MLVNVIKALRGQLKRSTALRKIVYSVRDYKSPSFRQAINIKAQEKRSKLRLAIQLSAPYSSMHYVTDHILSNYDLEIHAGQVLSRKLWQHFCNSKSDLAIIHTDAVPARLRRKKNAFVIPSWIGGVKDLNNSMELAAKVSQIKSDLRRNRKHRLGFRVTTELGDFDRFYHEMYVPYITNTYADAAFIMPYEELKTAIPHCELFLITYNGEDIAGGLLIYDDTNQVRAWSIGVRDGDRRWVRLGGLAALEYFETVYLLEKGYSQIHKGASRPFLKDGVLRFKLCRGMTISDHVEKSFVLLLKNITPGLLEFLERNPFLYIENNKLHGAVFISSDSLCDQELANTIFKELQASEAVNLNLFSFVKAGNDHVVQLRGVIDATGKLATAIAGSSQGAIE
jgi:hypothetical protein